MKRKLNDDAEQLGKYTIPIPWFLLLAACCLMVDGLQVSNSITSVDEHMRQYLELNPSKRQCLGVHVSAASTVDVAMKSPALSPRGNPLLRRSLAAVNHGHMSMLGRPSSSIAPPSHESRIIEEVIMDSRCPRGLHSDRYITSVSVELLDGVEVALDMDTIRSDLQVLVHTIKRKLHSVRRRLFILY